MSWKCHGIVKINTNQKPSLAFIEPGLPQRIGFTAEPMTCGMLWRCWIE